MVSLRDIPSVDQILHNPRTEQLLGLYGHAWTVSAIRELQEDLRQKLPNLAEMPSEKELIDSLESILEHQSQPSLRAVINATGVLLHTNLGRAPLSHAALAAIERVASGYSTLEYDLAKGSRGKRDMHASTLLTRLTGCESALVVNNNAAAVLLALSALAKGKKVAISRSQLVEIGGGFRIPDVMKQSGAKLVEVGTTNRTRLSDFEQAIAEGASMLLVAHQSNFKIIGFTEEPTLEDLAKLAHQHNLPLMVDLGSGALLDTAKYGLTHESTVQETLSKGADLVCFSGDKLLGGPQAGILVGKNELLAKIRRHPLYRAIRADKLCLAALSATLLHYLKGEAEQEIPLYQMLSRSFEDLTAQVQRWIDRLQDGSALEGLSTVGGGSLPGETLPTCRFALKVKSPAKFTAKLREANPPIIARVQEDLLLLDPRTVLPWQEETLLTSLQAILLERKELL
ncbi:MAG: L-seryl-tRNA(Sec) selenium transferase [Anaerolineaceae bacterium]